MKVLFIGNGLTDYFNLFLNKLGREAGVNVFNLVEMGGARNVPAGAHQTKSNIEFNLVELEGVTCDKYSDRSYWAYKGLPELLDTLQLDIIVVNAKYMRMFLYDTALVSKIKELGIKVIERDNPFQLERYEKRKADIVAGKVDDEYTPFYVLYFVAFLKRLGFRNSSSLTKATMSILRAMYLCSRTRSRSVLLARLEEKKRMLHAADANASYIEEAYDLWGSYGVPKEKIFVLYNSPDTDLIFAVRERIEKEPPVLPYNPHRIVHVGRLIPWKRVDMLIEAVGELQKEFPNTELLVIGYGPQEAELKALARERGLESKIKFIGGVYDQALLGKYFFASGVYVLAGMGGLSINDGMAFGRPIVCSVGDGTEKKLVYEGQNGMYFKDGDRDDLVAKLRYLFARPELLIKMGERSTEIIKNDINIHTVISRYRQAFDYVLKINR